MSSIFELRKELKKLSLAALETDFKYVITRKSDKLRYRFIPLRLYKSRIKPTKQGEIGLLHFEPYPTHCLHVTLAEVLNIFPLEDSIYRRVEDDEPWTLPDDP